MQFGAKLRQLRIGRSLTQAALAEALGVSDRAVSRWERGTAYPDMTLLPRIALTLETSADALLGMDPLHMEAEILRATEECTQLLNQDRMAEAVALMREKCALYPNQPELMVYLTLALQRTRTEDALREALTLCRAAEGGSSSGSRKMRLSTTYGCKQVMALALKHLGRHEEAARIAEDEKPAIWVSRELMLARVAPRKRAVRIRRSNVTLLSGLLISTLEQLSRDTEDAAFREAARHIRTAVDRLM